MRRTWLGALALLAATCTLTTAYARRADLPYAGTWKVTLIQLDPRQPAEVSLWLIKIDKEGKKVEVTGARPGPEGFDKAKVKEIKPDETAIRFTLQLPRNEFFIIAYAPKGKEKDTMLGTLRVGYNFLPIRIEKTELTELTRKNADAPLAGFPDLQTAMKTVDAEDRVKEFQDIIKTYENKPVAMVACQLLFGELMRKKAEANAFKPIAETYYKFASQHGREMQISAGNALGVMLASSEKTAPLGLEYAEKATKLLKKDDNRGVQLTTRITLAQVMQRAGKKDELKAVADTIKEVADVAIKNPRPGSTELGVTQAVAEMLLRSGVAPVADVGLGYARQALKMIKADAPVEQRLGALKLLRFGLAVRDRKEEFKTVSAEVEKIENDLDAKYLKEAIPFKVEKAARKGKSDRVVLVELFTGAHCPPCVAADIAFDAALKAYTPKEAVFLQYHVHIPAPDTLANAETVARAKFYDDIESAPTVLVNGETTKPMGGSDRAGKASYDALKELIDKNMGPESEAKITLEAKRAGDKIDVSAKVDGLKETGATIKLRLVLVEGVVRYPGANRRRLHHNVVRAFVGGGDGFKLENKSSTYKGSVDLTAVRKQMNGHLNQIGQQARFPNPERPMEMKKLKVIALVQDDITRKIFQAAQVDVPEAQEKKGEKKEEK